MKSLSVVMTVLLALAPVAHAGDINWRVSVKFILNAGGNRPASGSINTDQEVFDQINLANEILRATGRGYELQLTEIVDIAGESQWFNSTIDSTTRAALEAAAEADPAGYAWRTNAINFYVLGSSGSGTCSFPGGGNDAIIVGQGLRDTTFIHEIGHYMDLCHTQGCPCGSCDPNDVGQCHTTPGNDSISDTVPDLSCWDRDDISNWSFGSNYAGLTVGQQAQVDTVWFNVMSYHNTRDRYSSNQLDVSTDTSNDVRFAVATGETWFVDINAGGGENGSSTNPYDTVLEGANATSGGDIVLMRAGVYPEVLTISDPMCLRASRGSAVIGVGALLFAQDENEPQRHVIYPETYDGRTGP